MSLWDLLHSDLQDYIISIRDAEKKKDTLKLGYYMFKADFFCITPYPEKQAYYFNIVKVHEKTVRADVMVIRTHMYHGGPYEEKYLLSSQTLINIKTKYKGKDKKPFLKNKRLPGIFIRSLIPIDNLETMKSNDIFSSHYDEYINPEVKEKILKEIYDFFNIKNI